MRASTLFVGFGSSHGDDRVGWMVADALAPRLSPRAIVRHAAAPIDLLDWLDGIDRLALCDACRGIGPVGTWRRWAAPLKQIPAMMARHSHDLGVVAALELAARLGQLPRDIWLWGVEVGPTEPVQSASAEVAAAVVAVADDVANQLSCPLDEPQGALLPRIS
jgi:hydrogenase maturation protease